MLLLLLLLPPPALPAAPPAAAAAEMAAQACAAQVVAARAMAAQMAQATRMAQMACAAEMAAKARAAGLQLEAHMIKALKPVPTATVHQSRKHIFRSKRPYYRPIDHGRGPVLIHRSVKQRWQADTRYRPKNLVDYLAARGGQWPSLVG